MNSKLLCGLIFSTLVSSTALAETSLFSYTISTSDNLVEGINYSVSPWQTTYSYYGSLHETELSYHSGDDIYATFQDSTSGIWYEKGYSWERRGFSFYYDIYSQTYQSVQIARFGDVVGDNFVSISTTVIPEMAGQFTYEVSAQASGGIKTSPRGASQYISPAFGYIADAGPITSVGPYVYYPEYDTYISTSIFAADSLEFFAEATDGGRVSFVQVAAQTNFIYSGITEVSYRDEWTGSYFTREISAPVTVSEVTPVPEPETYAMLLAGIGIIGLVARRKMQA